MKYHRRSRCWVLAVGVVLLLSVVPAATLALPPALASAVPPSPERVIQRAWQAAQRLGVYAFTSEVAQTTFPAASLANFGRSSRQEAFYLEGDVDLPAQAMALRLWGGGGSLADTNTALELRLEGDHGFIRQPGGAWEEVDDVGAGFAPNNDMLAYLAGLKNIRPLGAPEPSTPQVTQGPRYTFEFDGPAFASYLRDQLEDYLRQRGELPLDLTLDSSRAYREATGYGEVWIDDRGLPLRLVVHLAYPVQENGERVAADIKTDFRFETAQSPASNPWTVVRTGIESSIPNARQTMRLAVILGVVLGLVLLALVRRRAKPVYTAIVLAVILSMVAVPLMQSQQAVAFFRRQAARQAESEQRQEQQAAATDLSADLTGANWDPHLDPLRVADLSPVSGQPAGSGNAETQVPMLSTQVQTVVSHLAMDDEPALIDTDNDGLTDADETDILGTDPARADTDGDGLSDGVEALRLGTNPMLIDSDDDGIHDNVEIAGFTFSGQRWYLNPNNPDTNGDGLIDWGECPALAGVTSVPTVVNCDTDGDGIPDPFDYDDDGDDVPDRVDISPNSVLDLSGKRAAKGDVIPFDAQNPFTIRVSGLTSGMPALVDMQLRPVTDSHLTYAMNVLDWPRDDAGQVQHVKNTTFATTDNLQARNTDDPRSQNGDMRLIPMLEIKLTGSQMPLKLTTPQTTVAVRGQISATVNLEQKASDANKVVLEWTLADSGGYYYVGVGSGVCPATPTASPADYQCFAMPGQETCTIGGKLTDLADGEHHVILTESTTKWSCKTIANIVNGPYANKMIDPAPLQPYGISVREADAEGTPAA